jgi:hypothetical protein
LVRLVRLDGAKGLVGFHLPEAGEPKGSCPNFT